MRLRFVSVAILLTAGALVVSARAAPFAQASAAGSQQPGDLLATAATYLEGYEHQFSAVVAEETYVLTTQSRVMGRPAAVVTYRTLRSDLVVVSLEGGQWLQFRDVYEVDGKAVRDHDGRLQVLFAAPSGDLLSRARQIMAESARYNLGVARDFNIPTMALGYLARANQGRSSFKIQGTKLIDGAPAVELTFRETAQPSRIRTPSGNVATAGRFWIRPASGAVVETDLTCNTDDVSGTITVTYAPESRLKLLVPVRMDESYRLATKLIDTGQATYSNFRAFTVDTKTIGRGGSR